MCDKENCIFGLENIRKHFYTILVNLVSVSVLQTARRSASPAQLAKDYRTHHGDTIICLKLALQTFCAMGSPSSA